MLSAKNLVVKSGLLLSVLVLTSSLTACSSLLSSFERQPSRVIGPLAGKIYQSLEHQVSRDDLFVELLEADVIYLGEQHENSRQHQLQYEIIQHLVDAGRPPAVAIEVVAFSQSSALLNYTANSAQNTPSPHEEMADSMLREALNWGDSDDYYWRNYGKILQLARKHQLTLVGFDLPLPLRSRITKLGIEKLTRVEKNLLASSDFEDPVYQQLMHERFKAAHCGYGSPSYLSKLYDNWLARNDRMATTIAQLTMEARERPVVVIVGSGHTQYNMGVYERLGALAPDLKQLNIGFAELHHADDEAADYIKPFVFADRDFGLEFDYYWFTEGQPPAEDRCAAFLKYKADKKADAE